MRIDCTSIRIIDYLNNNILTRNTPDSFNEYVVELISHIKNNDSVRNYKTRSNTTQVISSALQILHNSDNDDFVTNIMDGIADRLLRTEITAQEKVSRMRINVKKGSLIQALIYDEVLDTSYYLLAKVEHSDFVDDSDFSFKTGFSKDKKTIWKSCLFDLDNPNAVVFDVKVYSDTKAKFWSDDFLELDELINDETNTVKAFKAIDETLNRNVKKLYKEDYTFIRNAFITYFRSNDHINFSTMVDTVIGSYHPAQMEADKFNEFTQRIRELPQKRSFDNQFSPVPSAIDARIRKLYKINDGIELKITKDIIDIKNTIKSYQEIDGTRYIRIKTNDEDTYEYFRSNND